MFALAAFRRYAHALRDPEWIGARIFANALRDQGRTAETRARADDSTLKSHVTVRSRTLAPPASTRLECGGTAHAQRVCTMARTEFADHVDLQIGLQLDAAPDSSEFRVTIELGELDLAVQVIEADLGDALRGAAERCASRLRERGYDISPAMVLGALEDNYDLPAPPARTAEIWN